MLMTRKFMACQQKLIIDVRMRYIKGWPISRINKEYNVTVPRIKKMIIGIPKKKEDRIPEITAKARILSDSGLNYKEIADSLRVTPHLIKLVLGNYLYEKEKQLKDKVTKLHITGYNKRQIADMLGLSISFVNGVIGPTRPKIDKKAIIDDWRIGFTVKELVEKYKINKGTVRNILKSSPNYRRNKEYKIHSGDYYRSQMVSLVQCGMSIQEIADSLDITKAYASSLLKEFGLFTVSDDQRKRKEDEEKAVRLYQDGKTTAEIMEETGLCQRTVLKYLRKNGINTAELKGGNRNSKRELIRSLYDSGMDVDDIIKNGRVHPRTVRKHLKDKGVTVKISPKNRPNKLIKKEQTVLELHKTGLTISEISAKTGICKLTIRKYLRKNGYKANKKRRGEKEDLVVSLREDVLTVIEIANKVGISTTTVLKYLRRNGLDTVTSFNRDGIDKEKKILELYNHGKLTTEIMEETGCCYRTIRKILKKNGLITTTNRDKRLEERK